MDSGTSAGRATLADVAKRAGVSIQTASHVLAKTKHARIAPSTKQRVLQAAREVGYQPNRLAQAMKTGKTNIVSVWMPVDRPMITFLRFLNAVNDAAKLTGHDIMVVGLDSEVAYGDNPLLPNLWPSDGIFCYDAGRALQHQRESTRSDVPPAVVVGNEVVPNSDTVVIDIVGACHALTTRLISQGHKRIVHATPYWVAEHYANEQRRAGYESAMEEAGLEPIIVPVDDDTAKASASSFADFVARSGVPEAVTCWSDTIAIGVLRALLNAGAQVPENCKIWGYGDYPEAEDARVSLSTLQVPVVETVAAAWPWLVERMNGAKLEPRIRTVSLVPVGRESG